MMCYRRAKCACLHCDPLDERILFTVIAIKSINRDDGRDALNLNVLNLLSSFRGPRLDIRQIGFQQFFGQGFTGNDAIMSAMSFEGASRDDENRRVGSEAAVTALDIEKLLRA